MAAGEGDAMKERPIIMSGESVSAILAGTKTMTRRLIKGITHPAPGVSNFAFKGCAELVCNEPAAMEYLATAPAPFAVGMRLWVKETWAKPRCPSHEVGLKTPICLCGRIDYRATAEFDGGTWKSPLFLPRAHSRITLEVTAARAERLLDLSLEDALDEGLRPEPSGAYVIWNGDEPVEFGDPRQAYFFAWDGINPRANHDTNPWVWVVSFKRIESGGAAEGSSHG